MRIYACRRPVVFDGEKLNRKTRLLTVAMLFGCVLAAASQGVSREQISTNGFLEKWSSSDTVSGALFGTNNFWDTSYENWEAWKQEHHLPITIGAYNWFHINNGGPAASGYGIPGLRGTYYWYLDADPRITLHNDFIQAIGYHGELRFRESDNKFRSYFHNTHEWFYENYGYVDTPVGRLKGGQIWMRFGMDWDDTWWGDVQYFDGLKLDTGYGFSWENTWHPTDDNRFKLGSFVQYFITQPDVSGSLVGANPQSVPGSHERNIGVIRLVPTWQLTDKSSLAIGVSGLAGQIQNTAALGGDTSQLAWAADATYTYEHFKVFGEVDQSFGVINPNRYVSGGPSDRITDTEIGAAYQCGPVTYRLAWSAGFDANPSGHQYLWVPGVTVALTKNVTLYAEYVNWNVTNSADKRTVFENGFQLALNWRL